MRARTTDLAARHPELVEEFERWVGENRTEPPDQPARSPVGFRDYVELGPVHPAADGCPQLAKGLRGRILVIPRSQSPVATSRMDVATYNWASFHATAPL